MDSNQYQQFIETMKKQIDESVAIGIEKNVNGKIRAIDKKIDEYINTDNEWKKGIEDYKNEVKPVIDMGKDIRAGNRIFTWFTTFAMGMGALYATFKLFMNIKK